MAILTFKNLQDQVLALYDQTGDTGQSLTLVKTAIQTAHDKRLLADRWTFMFWASPVTIQFKSTVRNYTLHPLAAMLSDFTNDTAKQQMHETPTRARYKSGVQEDRFHFEFVQDSPVSQQPVAGKLTVTGSAQISFIDANSNYVTETVTDAQSVASATEVVKVTVLNANALTIVDVSANTILSLAAGEYGKQYPQIRLFDDGRAETGLYRFYRRPTLLTLDNDVPDIPYPFSRVLLYDSLLELATYNDATPQQYWLTQQEIWDRQMRQAYQEGEQEGSEARTVNETDLYGG